MWPAMTLAAALVAIQATATGRDEQAGIDTAAALTQYGPLGIFVVALGLFARLAYKREADRSDRFEAEIRALYADRAANFVPRDLYERAVQSRDELELAMREQALPALQAAGQATRESLHALEALRQEQEVKARIRDELRGRPKG
jgi:hypothetical protein